MGKGDVRCFLFALSFLSFHQGSQDFEFLGGKREENKIQRLTVFCLFEFKYHLNAGMTKQNTEKITIGLGIIQK